MMELITPAQVMFGWSFSASAVGSLDRMKMFPLRSLLPASYAAFKSMLKTMRLV